MGCDIHIVAERHGDDGRWELVGEAHEEEDGYIEMPQPYSGRNYDLFAMLANVRNGTGFAGCDTGDGFTPISPPAGVPANASEWVKKWVERWDSDGHSHSWLTVEDLLAYDWHGQVTRHRGWVNAAVYRHWVRNGRKRPHSWRGMVSGRGVRLVSNEEMDVEVANLDALDASLQEIGYWGDPVFSNVEPTTVREWQIRSIQERTRDYYTQVEWTETYAESAGDFLKETLPKLKEMGLPDRVRIVFFFDN